MIIKLKKLKLDMIEKLMDKIGIWQDGEKGIGKNRSIDDLKSESVP
jgi:ribosome assembly protein YihI (activator of Der GTPase)